MSSVLHFRDTVAHKIFQPDTMPYFNPEIGQVATLDVIYDYAALRDSLDRDALSSQAIHSMWRYHDLLPLAENALLPPLAVGWTPLYNAEALVTNLGFRECYVKDDGLNPTGSLKDRASAMVVAKALEIDARVVSTASTGNAAAALAGVGASVTQKELEIVIFVPSTAPQAKITQLLVYGATVLLVEDSYDVAFDLCYETCVQEDWLCRNTGINPYTTEGKKTAAFEIAEQLNWDVPDVAFVGVGDGSIISGLHKGFSELHELGWIERIPRLIGVQAEGSSPLVKAWENNVNPVDMQAETVNTIADSISAGLPRDRVKAMRAVKETGGAFVAVSDEAILAAIPAFARLTGIFCEPSSAAIYAGAKRAKELGYVSAEDRVVFVATGTGLKDIPGAQKSVSGGMLVKPELDAVRQALNLE